MRLQAEEAARIRSEKIDEEINQERLALKKGPKPVKLLLLGTEYFSLCVEQTC